MLAKNSDMSTLLANQKRTKRKLQSIPQQPVSHDTNPKDCLALLVLEIQDSASGESGQFLPQGGHHKFPWQAKCKFQFILLDQRETFREGLNAR